MQMVDECSLDSDEIKKTWQPWVVCFAASLFFFYEFIQGNMFASIADNIMRDFHIQADKMTYLSSIYYASNVIFLFISGQILDRCSAKKTLLMAMLLCVMSTFVLALSHSFYVALACRFMTGIGSAFCFLGPVRLASAWFPPKKMAFVTGAVVTMAMTGGMLAQYPLTTLVVRVGFRHALLWVGWLGLGLWALMGLLIRDRAVKRHEIVPIGVWTSIKKAYLNLITLRIALYTSLMNMGVAVFGAMMGSLYLMQRLGVDKEHASFVNALLFLGAILGGPIMGYWSDRLGQRLLPMKLGALLALLTMLCILYLPVSLTGMAILFFLLGFFTASQVIGYALVAEHSSSVMTATALSVVSVLTQGGYILYQNVFSHLLLWREGMHVVKGIPVYPLVNYQTASMMLPVGLFCAWWVLCSVKETYCRHVVQESA